VKAGSCDPRDLRLSGSLGIVKTEADGYTYRQASPTRGPSMMTKGVSINAKKH
jgi:hypothetical protein